MPKDRRIDSQEFCPVLFGYDARPNPPDDLPRLGEDSYNTFITSQGSISKRPGDSASGLAFASSDVVKMWDYETLPDTTTGVTKKYLIFCIYNGSTYELLTYSLATFAFTTPVLRDCDASIRIHEIVIFKGKAYVQAFPASGSSEKLGTIILDGSSGAIVEQPWGLLPPDTPARIVGKITKLNGNLTETATTITVDSTTGFAAPTGRIQIGYEIIDYTGTTATTFTGCSRGANSTDKVKHDDNESVLQRTWTASDHKVDVNDGWYYSYAYKSITGQVSSRAEIEKNPDLLPSYTGPFFDLIPKITVKGQADTTNIPKIVIYRTKDGGGTFLKLEEITNTGAGDITYEDKSHGTGASSTTKNDPIPDDILDGEDREFGPSTVSNGPPPTVEDPQVIGTDTPSKLCYAMAVYAGRIWKAVGTTVFFSSREELVTGVNEESFMSGTKGNFIPFGELIVGMETCSRGLYVLTTKRLIRINGTTKDTFTDIQIATIGGRIPDFAKMGRIMCPVKEAIAFITRDYSVAMIENDEVKIISDPVIRFYMRRGRRIEDIQYYRTFDYEIIIASYNNYDFSIADSVTNWFCYDLKKSKQLERDFWWAPWNMNSGMHLISYLNTDPVIYRLLRDSVGTKARLVLFGSFTPGWVLGVTDYISLQYQDFGNPATTDKVNYGSETYIPSLRPPPGNNLNLVNRPQRNAELEGIYVHWHPGANNVLYGVANAEPLIGITTDNNNLRDSLTSGTPPRIVYSTTNAVERISYFTANKNCYRVNLRILSEVENKGMEVTRLSTWWDIAGGIE